MKKISSNILCLMAIVCGLAALCSCGSEHKESLRGIPVLNHEDPVYDEASQSFSLTLTADSTDGAKVMFFLLDGEKIIMKNETGQFSGIAPLDEGYNVYLSAEWEDTTIVTSLEHIFGFVLPHEPIEAMSKEDLQQFINAKDKGIKLGEIEKLEQGVWTSVQVTKVEYDENNLITDVTLKPTEKEIKEEDYEEEVEYIEF